MPFEELNIQEKFDKLVVECFNHSNDKYDYFDCLQDIPPGTFLTDELVDIRGNLRNFLSNVARQTQIDMKNFLENIISGPAMSKEEVKHAIREYDRQHRLGWVSYENIYQLFKKSADGFLEQLINEGILEPDYSSDPFGVDPAHPERSFFTYMRPDRNVDVGAFRIVKRLRPLLGKGS